MLYNFCYRNVIEYETCEVGSNIITTVHFSNATQQWFLNQDGTITTYCETQQVLVLQSGNGSQIVLASIEQEASITYFESYLVLNVSTDEAE